MMKKVNVTKGKAKQLKRNIEINKGRRKWQE